MVSAFVADSGQLGSRVRTEEPQGHIIYGEPARSDFYGSIRK